ncbi:HD-GYP domain-containing protein [Virgibacillus soli]|uniref:HD-GYP domain-containing protein n=1 Tax=Paracerasibacillus soli TaxID=480284 RepID=UPI0035EC0271
MRVHPSQLTPGYTLLHDVKGKTNDPIMKQGTILTDLHIKILKKFLIEEVQVEYHDAQVENKVNVHASNHVKQEESKSKESLPTTAFHEHYMEVVAQYKKYFISWQNYNIPDFHAVRELIMPLLKQVESEESAIPTLYQYATKKEYLFHHSVAVSVLSAYVAMKMGYTKQKWLQVGLAGLLSDIGMAKITESTYNKAASLTLEERMEMEKHPTYSYQFIKDLPFITEGVKLAVLQHHERTDGSGYPLRLKGEQIHPYARIIAVCDTYHAMACNRIHTEKQPTLSVARTLEQAKYAKYDPAIVWTLLTYITNLSIGEKVKLSNGAIGKIIFIDQQYPTRPMIALEETKEIISLKEQPTIYIEKVIS